MTKIGLTGECCSGKTYICNIFKESGIKVYNTDLRVKYLQNTNHDLRNQIIEYLGPKSYIDSDGSYYSSGISILDSKYVADIIFNDDIKKKRIVSMITPYLLEDYAYFCENNRHEVFTIVESDILFESGWNEIVDYIIYVQASESKRIERFIKRSAFSDATAEYYKLRMKDQFSPIVKAYASDWVINNFTEISKKSKVDEIINEILLNAKYS